MCVALLQDAQKNARLEMRLQLTQHALSEKRRYSVQHAHEDLTDRVGYVVQRRALHNGVDAGRANLLSRLQTLLTEKKTLSARKGVCGHNIGFCYGRRRVANKAVELVCKHNLLLHETRVVVKRRRNVKVRISNNTDVYVVFVFCSVTFLWQRHQPVLATLNIAANLT